MEDEQLQPVLDERFDGAALDPGVWVPHYLPQWTTPDRSAARYDLQPGLLRLRIDADQPAWRPEDGELRVSNVQTATFSGPAGSAVGTHRHRADLTVRTPVPHRRLLTFEGGGRVEAELRATADPTCMLAIWLVGVEDDSPEHSGEICIAELYGHAVGAAGSTVRVGIKAHHDPQLRDDVLDVPLQVDARDWHTYAASWTPSQTRFWVDDELVHVAEQGIGYPLQLMVDLFEFPADGARREPGAYPKRGDVRAVRAFSR